MNKPADPFQDVFTDESTKKNIELVLLPVASY